jgi:hypothetical protein
MMLYERYPYVHVLVDVPRLIVLGLVIVSELLCFVPVDPLKK